MQNKFKIYLDWNVFADFLDGNFTWLEDIILSNQNRFSIPFSSEHIEEATNINSKKEIDRRLNYISKISSNLYFVNDMIDTGYKTETPASVFQTLNDVALGIDPQKLISGLIDYNSLKKARIEFGLYPNVMNNIKPENAIQKIDEILSLRKESQEHNNLKNQDISFFGLFKKGLEISEESHKNTNYHDIISKKNTYQLNNFVVLSFILLDTLGFWSDQKSTYARGSQFTDSRHAFNAIFMDALISNDKRFCMKSQAVYKYFNFGLEVFFLKEDKNQIKKFLNSLIKT